MKPYFFSPYLVFVPPNTPENICWQPLTALSPLREYKDRETIQWAEEAVESERTVGVRQTGREDIKFKLSPARSVLNVHTPYTRFDRLDSCEHGCPWIYAERSNSYGQRKVWIVYLTGWRQLTAPQDSFQCVYFFLKVKKTYMKWWPVYQCRILGFKQ